MSNNAPRFSHIATRQHYAALTGVLASPFIQVPFLPAIVPFLIFLFSTKDDEDGFVRGHAWQAIKFQAFVLGYTFIACVMVSFLTNTPLLLHQPGTALVLLHRGIGPSELVAPMWFLFLLGIVMPLFGANEASKKKEYVYPVTITFASIHNLFRRILLRFA